jgi:hypothetical protein
MKKLPVIILLLVATAAAYASDLSTGQESVRGLTAQYLTDDEEGGRAGDTGKKKTIGDLKKEGSAKVRPQFVMGISGGLDAREGFASISASVPMGMQYGKYALTFFPAYTYMSARSIKTKSSPVSNIVRTKTDGQVYEFTLPAMFSYYILDVPAHLYTPYVTGGVGYSFRKFSLNGSSLVSMTGRVYTLHSMTLNYGFGFLVRTSEETRFNIGLTCQSYFNQRNGPFDYDTTGASIQFGLMLIID